MSQYTTGGCYIRYTRYIRYIRYGLSQYTGGRRQLERGVAVGGGALVEACARRREWRMRRWSQAYHMDRVTSGGGSVLRASAMCARGVRVRVRSVAQSC